MRLAKPTRETLHAGLITAGLFLVYAAGSCHTIYVGDSGELVAAVHTLGIPHPSGYPLYVLLGKLWTLALPVGSVAWRMSLFSAVSAALACGALYLVCRKLELGLSASLTASLLLAFSPSFWSQANIQRVYTLNALFVVLASAAAFRWWHTRHTRPLLVAFFLCGLGATNHTFMAVFALALMLQYVASENAQAPGASATEPRRFSDMIDGGRRILSLAGCFVLGLLPYAYLPIRSQMNPRLDWGNPESFGAFVDVVLRRSFWQRAWIEHPSDLLPITADYLGSLGHETAWLGLLLAGLGFVAGWRRRWPVVLPALVMAGNLGLMALHGSRSDLFIWHRYYIPSYIMMALLAGMGCRVLVERLPRWGRWAPILIPLFLLTSGYASFDRSRYRIAEDFAYAVLESLPPGAHLIATDDNVLFVLIYLQLVEGRRPDIDLILQGVGKTYLPPLRFNPETDPLFFTHHPNWSLPRLEIVPVGVAYRAWPRGAPLPPVTIPRQYLDGEQDPRVPKDYLTRNLIGHFHYTAGFAFERRDWLHARVEFDKAAAAAPENDVLFYNLGLLFSRNGLYEDAIAAFRRSQEINPRHIASLSKPRAAARLAKVIAERDRIAQIESTLLRDAGGSPLRASATDHRHMAELLDEAGEHIAARGHLLRALEIERLPLVAAPSS